MAFGTGEHPTTLLCLEAIEECAFSGRSGSLLDIGTGTGILAIAAAKLGFSDITAIDNDPVAVKIALDNIRKNNITNTKISDDPLSSIKGTFNVVVANLTSETIKTLFDDIVKRLNKGGTGIFSGILEEQVDDMLSFFRSRGMQHAESREQNGWCRIIVKTVQTA